jgi:heat shock protein HtpX
MVMDFWEAQRRARNKTIQCVIAFIVLTVLVAVCAELAMRSLAQDSYDTPIPVVGLIFLGMTFGVAWFQYTMYKTYGGSYAAKSVHARQVDPRTSNAEERQLLNIVEEMALAASVPIPPAYIIPADEINAFAAGLTPEDTVIAVTRGALRKLNREELQGVIGHEMGHVHNVDMKISLRLAAMLMGFFFILSLGFRVLQFSSFRGNGENKKGPNPVMLAAIILMVAGLITWFAGGILKAMVSRQREYLADASAVQFTRSSTGIANALRKIGKDQSNDMPKEGMAISHMYLNDHSFWSQLFATHPPLEDRIAAIEGEKDKV